MFSKMSFREIRSFLDSGLSGSGLKLDIIRHVLGEPLRSRRLTIHITVELEYGF